MMHRGKGMKFVGDSRVPAERKPNIPKDYSEYPGKTEAFWPNFLLKEWMVGAVFLVGFLMLTISHVPPLERIADPTDSSYIPTPDWYFLFLYQLLKYKYTSGDYIVIGTVVIPGIAFGGLLLAPFLDRGPERRPIKRPIASGLMLLALASIVYLTYEAVSTHDWEAAAKQGAIVKEVEINKDHEGYQVWSKQATCKGCHGESMSGNPGVAPAVFEHGYSKEEVIEIITNGKGAMSGGLFNGTPEELEKLADYIAAGGNPK